MSGIHTVKINKFCKFLKHCEFVEERQRGGHLIFSKKGLPRPVVVAIHGKEVDFYDCLEIMKILNMSRDELLKELKKY
ncbi:MAG: type II toxin-antitoxin system HicA family toxin [Endomicrobium sp.]|jgi:predicted RNA binding protein YcfA (HicA-like mRNA interferase family)|nr:type II toxin-antitoxin system HicA family toxin [Endomicrobium sp.]